MFCHLCVIVNDVEQSAKVLLLLANTADDQKIWVHRLGQKVAKNGFVQAAGDGKAVPPGTTG